MNDCKHKFDNGLLEKDNAYTVETWFHTWLSDLRATHLQSYYKELLESGTRANIIRTVNKHLGTSMNLALKQGVVMRNYCDLVTLLKAEKKDDEVIKCFSETEQKTLIASLEGNRNKC